MSSIESIRTKIKSLEAMPTVPAIVQPLSCLLRQPAEQVDLERVVELVSYDSTIAAQCLRMANSPLFGRRSTETVRSAVIALGIKRIEAILLGCCLNRIVPEECWSIDPNTFWRHSLGCALVSSRLAKIIGYPDPEKAYLAGLLHDMGILVNTVACTADFRNCVKEAGARHVSLHRCEQEQLGFTHCESGKILGEHWKFTPDVIAAIEFHHDTSRADSAADLVSLVYLSDLLCRLRDLGYGYYEAIGVDLAGEGAWLTLVEHYPALARMDLARLTLDIDGAMDEIVGVVDAVFGSRAPEHS